MVQIFQTPYGREAFTNLFSNQILLKEFKPNGAANYTFTADNGQYVQVQIHNLWFTDHKTFGCAVYDSQNGIVFENNFSPVIGSNRFGFLSQTRGQYTLMIYNQPDVTTQLTVEIIGYNATFRPSISIGVLLILISLPLYGFGTYLITRKKNNTITHSSNFMKE